MIRVKTREDFLTDIASRLPTKCTAVEIGVLMGEFSQMILDIVKPGRLFLVDPFQVGKETYGEELNNLPRAYSTESDYLGVCEKFKKEIQEVRVIVDKRYSYDAAKDYPDNSIDFLYIDADHSYFSVKRDLDDWLPKMKKDGIISGHDMITHFDFGVVEAVGEFCVHHGLEVYMFNDSGGDWAIKIN